MYLVFLKGCAKGNLKSVHPSLNQYGDKRGVLFHFRGLGVDILPRFALPYILNVINIQTIKLTLVKRGCCYVWSSGGGRLCLKGRYYLWCYLSLYPCNSSIYCGRQTIYTFDINKRIGIVMDLLFLGSYTKLSCTLMKWNLSWLE